MKIQTQANPKHRLIITYDAKLACKTTEGFRCTSASGVLRALAKLKKNIIVKAVFYDGSGMSNEFKVN